MSREIRTSVVIVGLDVREAQSLAMQRRNEDRGEHVVVLGMGYQPRQRIEGLRVREFIASPRAQEHPSWPDLHDALAMSQSMTGATTSE